MAKRPTKIEKIEDEDIIHEDEGTTPAAQTLKTHPIDSKTGMMANVMGVMANMSKEQMTDFLDLVLSQIGHEADGIPDGTADKNRMSIAAKGAMKEDVLEIFGSEDLSEEFKMKIETLFEAAVDTRVTAELERIEEEAALAVEDNVSESVEELIEKTDKYLSYVAEKWLEENEVIIDKSIKADLAEEVINKIRNALTSSGMNIPEDSIDIVEELSNNVEDLEEKYNNSLKDNIALLEQIETLEKESLFKEMSEGLTVSQVEKFRSLTEGFEYDIDTYSDKLEIVKEQYFKTNGSTTSKKPFLVEEENDYSESSKLEGATPDMRAFAESISKTSKSIR